MSSRNITVNGLRPLRGCRCLYSLTFREGVFSETGLPNGLLLLLGTYLCSVGFAGVLQRPELGIDPHDDGVQCELQAVRFFWGAQALRERTGFVQLRSYLLQYV